MTTTRQNEVRRILQKLHGHEPDESTVAKMANIAEASEIYPGDALFPLMIALEYYKVAFEKIPDSIKEANSFLLREHSNAFAESVNRTTADQKAEIEEFTKKLLATATQWLQQATPTILQKEVEKAATIAVKEPVQIAANRFEEATRVALSATQKLRQVEKSGFKTWIAAVVVSAVLGGVAGGGMLAYWLKRDSRTVGLTQEQQEAIELGNSVKAVWPKLSPQVQKIIKDSSQ